MVSLPEVLHQAAVGGCLPDLGEPAGGGHGDNGRF